MIEPAHSARDPDPERPIPETYWVVPGRLLVGEYPGSVSRAAAMDRLRRFTDAGVTCFIDLTEPDEVPPYEPLLPGMSRDGRRIEHFREPLPDHGVPASRDVMLQVLDTLEDALEGGHVVYLHCRAGLGRSAMVAGCWLANRAGRADDPLDALRRRWQSCAKSSTWPVVPETEEQAAYVREWRSSIRPRRGTVPSLDLSERVRGALLGLAVGDAAGAARERGSEAQGLWTQHTALTLCLAESLLECGRNDARDQMERYLRWQREGHLSATGRPGDATPDVAKALATYQWRRQAAAGSHDPRNRGTSSLPRVLAAVAWSIEDPAGAVHLAGECSRTTHQSPFVIDACRYCGAMLAGALRGATPQELFDGLYEPVPGLWTARPLKAQMVSLFRKAAQVRTGTAGTGSRTADAVHAVVRARAAVALADGFDDALRRACEDAVEPALEAAITGTLYGATFGSRAIPSERSSQLARLDVLESFAARLAHVASRVSGDRGGGR